MKPNEHQRPEGALLGTAQANMKLSARQAAGKAGMSDARWRQIVNGYASAGAGQTVEVIGPDETIARMARVVGVTPEQLREAGRPIAADLLLVLAGAEVEKDWQHVGSALDRLRSIRDELEAVIGVLSDSQVSDASRSSSTPNVEVPRADEHPVSSS